MCTEAQMLSTNPWGIVLFLLLRAFMMPCHASECVQLPFIHSLMKHDFWHWLNLILLPCLYFISFSLSFTVSFCQPEWKSVMKAIVNSALLKSSWKHSSWRRKTLSVNEKSGNVFCSNNICVHKTVSFTLSMNKKRDRE